MSLSRLAVCRVSFAEFRACPGAGLRSGNDCSQTAVKRRKPPEPEDLGTLLPPPGEEPGAPSQQKGAKP